MRTDRDEGDGDQWPCCEESSIVVYHRGLAVAHCYSGTRATWEKAEAQGYFSRDCNSSYMIVGAIE